MTTNFTREQRLIGLIKEISSESLVGDDCAVLPGERLVSSDMLVEAKHFLLPQMGLDDLGWKAMTVNLSDIAAMGGVPEYALVNIAMPAKMSDDEFKLLFSAMHECARQFGTRIVGGDLTGSDKGLLISITVMGRAGEHGVLMRSGARPGQLVVATGDFGASALGLELLLRGKQLEYCESYALARHFRPTPRVKEGQKLVELQWATHGIAPDDGGTHGLGNANGGTYAEGMTELVGNAETAALMDSSDGLADALIQIARASSVAIIIDADKIPVHAETVELARKLGLDPLELALYGGEDYELVACVSRSVWSRLSETGDFKVLGTVEQGSGASLKSASGVIPIDGTKTFQHWRTN